MENAKIKKVIEIIVPCYNESACVELFYEKITELFANTLTAYDYRLLFIDDGSGDDTLSKIKKLCEEDSEDRLHYVSLSRNFGKEPAIYVGLSHATGDYVAVMDADLQHPPELLPEMIRCIEEEGYDSCAARRVNRKGEGVVRSFLSRTFYHVMNQLTGLGLMSGSTDYRLMTRQMTRAVVSLSERERFTKGIYNWVGFKTKWIPYQNVQRVAGTSKWSISKLFNYASSGIIAFAATPLRACVWLGMIIVIGAVVYGIDTAAKVLMHPENSNGRATIVLIMLFLGGVIITILGMMGEYLARIYMEVKQRPIYIVRESDLSMSDVTDGTRGTVSHLLARKERDELKELLEEILEEKSKERQDK